MKRVMLINAVHPEQKRLAIVDAGKLIEYNIQMADKEPITGNIYKGTVMKVERGLQAAFVNYGGRRDGFLPLHDVGPEYFTEQGGKEGQRPFLKSGQEVLVQVVREESERKGALLTTYVSLPGRYLVLLPNKESSGISRKIEDEEDRKRLKKLMEQVKIDDGIGFIIRTAGMHRTKQELSRDYQMLSRLWKEIQKRAKTISAPALIYQESNFGVCSLRDYYTSEIEEILVDDIETYRKMREYSKAVVPRIVKLIKLYKEKTPLFDKYRLEDQIRVIYQDRVELKSGGYIIINPTEAMTTIDVNSGRASNKRNVEETAFRTNLEAAEEIARQLRLRDLGGLLVIDFIDMRDRKHEADVEKTFKKALNVDRARIQMSRISKFGILELSRQKKQSTIQEISYTSCPYCKGRGVRPSLEYTALSAFRRIESQAVRGNFSDLKVKLPYEVADYLLNRKRSEIVKLEGTYDVSINISGSPEIPWDELKIDTVTREAVEEIQPEEETRPVEAGVNHEEERTEPAHAATQPEAGLPPQPAEESVQTGQKPSRRKSRRRPRYRRKKTEDKSFETVPPQQAEKSESLNLYRAPEQKEEPAVNPRTPPVVETEKTGQDLLSRLRRVFEQLGE
ncbi:MAG TPA: Rne/Rng family ribonuclease [Syntrophales bacterium]|nr:Rne/Rng family ribonuclease [Syntrophales bacterium]